LWRACPVGGARRRDSPGAAMGKQVRQAARVPKAAVKQTQEQAEDGEVQQLSYIPADPEDPRLQLSGAVCTQDGKLDVAAYEDLQECYKGEPPPEKHPDLAHPGVRKGEVIPKGLRIWDDVERGSQRRDGAGWIAMHSSKLTGKTEKWFNIRTCGSWRLAFVLARLQRALWEHRGAAAAAARAPAPGGEAAGAGPVEPTTPKGKRRAPQADGPDTARKQRRGPEAPLVQEAASTGEEKEPEAAPQAKSAAQLRMEAMQERLRAKFATSASDAQADGKKVSE